MLLVQNKESIEVISDNADLTNVSIYNTSGKLFTSRYGNATNKVVFPIGIFSTGIYFVKSGYFSNSFIVKRR